MSKISADCTGCAQRKICKHTDQIGSLANDLRNFSDGYLLSDSIRINISCALSRTLWDSLRASWQKVRNFAKWHLTFDVFWLLLVFLGFVVPIVLAIHGV